MRTQQRRRWHPTPVFLPGKSHGWRSLVGCSPWGREELDMTEQLHFHCHALEKEMATHSSVLAWRIPGTGKPGGLLSMRSHWVGHDWSDLAAAAAATLVRLHFSSWARSLWGHRSPLTLGMGSCSLGTAYTSGPWSFPLSSLFPWDKCSKGDLPFLLSFFLILG